QLFLFRIQGLRLQHARADGRLVLGSRLRQTDQRILNVYTHLVFQALQSELLLAQRQLVVDHLRLRRAVTDRDRQVETGGVIGEVAGEDLAQRIAKAPDEERIVAAKSAGRRRQRRGLPRQAVIGDTRHRIERGQERVPGALDRQQLVVHLDPALRQLR